MILGEVLTTDYSDIIVRKKTSENSDHITYLLSKQKVFIDKTTYKESNFKLEEVKVFK